MGATHKIRESLRTAVRRAVIVCALLFALSPLMPLCGQEQPREFTYYPQETLPPNGRIILSGTTENFRQYVRAIDRNALQLVADGDSVGVRIDEILEEEKIMQGLLVPERPLTPGKTYRLTTNWVTAGGERAAWLVREEIDTLPPVWNGPVAYIGGCHRPEGSHYAFLALPLAEAYGNETAIETLVIRKRAGELQDDTALVYLFPRETVSEDFSDAILVSGEVVLKLDPSPGGQRVSVPEHLILPVGAGKYGGGIPLQAGSAYRLVLTAVDAAGNRSAPVEGELRVPAMPASEQPTAGGAATAPATPPQHRPLIPVFERIEAEKTEL